MWFLVPVAANLYAESLLHARTPARCLEAADVLEKAGDHLRCAEAVNHYMRIATKGNTITIEGPLDTTEHKRIWGEFGGRALHHARLALEAQPNDARAAAAYADAYMFHGSSKGLVSQALSGAGKQFLKNAKRLQSIDHKYDAGLGYTLEGCFHHLAPWPLHSPAKAKATLLKAVQVSPSRRNHYHYGVVSYCYGDYATAVRAFESAIKCTPRGNECDFADFMRAEAQRALPLARAKLNV